ISNLTPVTRETTTAPVHVTRRSPPPLAATSSVSFSPEGMRAKGEVVSITFSVDVTGANGGELALEVIAPDGTMYQRPQQPLQADPFATQHFEFTVPVAGTWIDSMSLTGTWSAHLLHGDAELLHDTFDLLP
ncbi:MAG: hypothetical protein JNK82_38900, partial [Myxococcaceae bacterium]|nr:hypothetical protein [Myxococcaceae bacterium]